MILSSTELEPRDILSCDLCIIGSGPAGISLALDLPKSIDVIVLEAGGETVSAENQDAYRGRVHGSIVDDEYLSSSRLRCIGGSSGHWAGWCRPFDEHDFSGLAWIEDSKWPIRISDLEDYYSRAAKYVEIHDWSNQASSSAFPDPFARSSNFRRQLFHISPPTRFASRYSEQLAERKNVRLITDAAVSEIEYQGSVIEKLKFYSKSNSTLEVKANTYVLACGGIENARLLMNFAVANKRTNRLKWLGRGFSDHAEYSVGLAIAPLNALNAKKSTIGKSVYSDMDTLEMYFPQYHFLKKHSLPNFALQLTPISEQRCPADLLEYSSIRSSLLKQKMQLLHMRLRPAPRMRFENGLNLEPEVDSFGLNRIKLNWEISKQEVEDLRKASTATARELSSQHNTAVKLLETYDEPFKHAQYASHHVGTTRMGVNEDDGVVNSNCRMFGVDNLFVAGSSVFRTAGVANPTLTILALTLRLGAHLQKHIFSGK